MSSTPLICSSSGVATVSAITFGLAPGNCARTTTDGGTTSGYSEIGNLNIDMAPIRKISTDSTPAKMGRSIKNFERFMLVSAKAIPWRPAKGGHHLLLGERLKLRTLSLRVQAVARGDGVKCSPGRSPLPQAGEGSRPSARLT